VAGVTDIVEGIAMTLRRSVLSVAWAHCRHSGSAVGLGWSWQDLMGKKPIRLRWILRSAADCHWSRACRAVDEEGGGRTSEDEGRAGSVVVGVGVGVWAGSAGGNAFRLKLGLIDVQSRTAGAATSGLGAPRLGHSHARAWAALLRWSEDEAAGPKWSQSSAAWPVWTRNGDRRQEHDPSRVGARLAR